MWVIVFALTLVISMGGAYAYFTATATKKQSEMTTAIIKVALTDTQLKTTSEGSTTATKILPGSTINYSGKVQNTGNTDMYALLEFNVFVEGSNEPIQTAYYAPDESNTKQIAYSDSLKEYTTGATQIAASATKGFNLTFTFDKTYGNEYKGKTATLKVTAHAIQFRNIASAVAATNLLLDGTSGNTETLPSNYTELAYIQSTGAQYFDTDFQVASSTDNYIIETSIMWTSTTTRQLMGYSSTESGYFGIRTDYYDLGSKYGGRIKPDTTSYAKLRVVRSKTDNTHKLYVNNNLAGQSSVDAYSGKFQLFALGSGYKCYCKMTYFKIFQDGAMKYNLIPAKDASGVVGMYDTVNNKFYTSTSGTAFVAGPVAEPTNLLDSSLFASTGTKSGLTFTCDKATGYITINGTATAANYWNPTAYQANVIDGHKIAVVGMVNDGQGTIWGLLNQTTAAQEGGSGAICTINGSLGKTWGVVWKNGATYNNFKFKPRLYDLTELYGAGNEPATIFDLNKDYNRNIWTCNKTSNFYKYDGADQSYTMVNNGASSTQCHGSASVFTLPTAIPTGTTITLSVYCLSGAITEGTLTLGGYHYEGSASSWQNLITLPLNQNLTGKKFTKTFTTTNTLTDFWLFSYYSTLENVKFKVQLEFGSTATSYQPYLGGLTK